MQSRFAHLDRNSNEEFPIQHIEVQLNQQIFLEPIYKLVYGYITWLIIRIRIFELNMRPVHNLLNCVTGLRVLATEAPTKSSVLRIHIRDFLP